MKLVTAGQSRELDGATINEMGIPGVILMENAGAGCAGLILDHFDDVSEQGVLVVCACGNNGGDGFVIARHLSNYGYDVDILLLGTKEKIKGDARINFNIVEKLAIPVIEVDDSDGLDDIFLGNISYGLLVDAIFGTGLARNIEGLYAHAIDLINGDNAPVFSVDIPSGLNSDTGQEMGIAVYADMTATFGLSKVGQWLYPGRLLCGDLKIVDISIPPHIVHNAHISTSLIDTKTVIHMFLPRNPNAHKGDFGHAFILGGATGMTGAVAMAGQSALKAGAGLVTLGIPGQVNNILEAKVTEVMTTPFGDNDSAFLEKGYAKGIIEALKGKSVVAIGPGIGKTEETKNLLYEILPKLNCPVVIDADGLNLIADDLSILGAIKGDVILTPHPGEMSRLTGMPVDEIISDPIKSALDFAKQYSVHVILKGGCTIIATPDGEKFLNSNGNPGMATGGSGDVLTGIIAGFLSQGWSSVESAVGGVFIHGMAGDIALGYSCEKGLTAGDIIDALPQAIGHMEDILMNSGVDEDQ